MFEKIVIGIIAYLNSFLLLDWLREKYKGRAEIAVIVVAIVSIIILTFLGTGSIEPSIYPPQAPKRPAETFLGRRYTRTL